MDTVNIHEAKTNFSRLVERAIEGHVTIIARAGLPVAKLVPLEPAEPRSPRRLGFMRGQGLVPDRFDRFGEGEIEALFAGRPD